MGSQNWSREQLAYLAGIFEGEGCIGWRRSPGPHLELRIGMTDQDVIEWVAGIAGIGTVYGPYRKFAPDGREMKQQWQYITTGSEAFALAVAIWPWLFSRRQEQVRVAIIRWRSVPNRIRHLTPEQVRAIRLELAEIDPNQPRVGRRGKGSGRGSAPAPGPNMASIARKYGVPTTSIRKIRTGETYQFVK